MTKIDELNREIEEVKNNVNALKLENKIDEPLVIVDEIKIKKS